MYAVIQTGGKQYRVAEGDILRVELLDKEPKAKVTFDQVLLVDTNGDLKVGQPTVKGASVEAEFGSGIGTDVLSCVAGQSEGRTMSIRVVCPNGHMLRVQDSCAGKTGLCPVCRALVRVPEPAGQEPVSEDAILGFLGPHQPSRAAEPPAVRADVGPDLVEMARELRNL